MGFVYEILKEINSKSYNYKGVRVNLLGIPKFKNHSKNSLSGTLSYLHKTGLIEKTDTKLKLTPKGKEYIKRKIDSFKQFELNFSKNKPKNLIVMYDIPEVRKAEREWLRWHLKKFGYVLIQKSVWMGPSPLPKDFLDYIKEIKLKNCIKTFKLAKGHNFNKQ